MGVQNLRLFLASELRMAHIELMQKWKLDAEFVGLRCLTEMYYQNGLISREVRDFYVDKYSKPLPASMPTQKPVSRDVLEEQQRLQEQRWHWQTVLAQWDSHKDNLVWVERTVNYAQKYKDVIPDAGRVVELGEHILRNHVLLGATK